MQPSEAWRLLQYHFFESEGLFDQIEHSQEISQTPVQEVEEALATIHKEWERRRTIPRQQALSLWNIVLRLKSALENEALYKQEKLYSLIRQIEGWLEEVFNVSRTPMGEEQALDVLLQHMLGGPSFGLALRQGFVDKAFFQGLISYLKNLQIAWEGKQELSRRACEAMFVVEQVPWSSETFSETERQELAKMREVLYEQITSCFQGNATDKTDGMQ